MSNAAVNNASLSKFCREVGPAILPASPLTSGLGNAPTAHIKADPPAGLPGPYRL